LRRKNTAINFIQNDLKALREKACRMEDMLEMLIDIYTDAIYVVKDEYVEKLRKVLQEGRFEEFPDLERLKGSSEEG